MSSKEDVTRNFFFNTAHMILGCLIARNMTWDDLDEKMERESGWSKRILYDLIEVNDPDLTIKDIANIAWSVGLQISFNLNLISEPLSADVQEEQNDLESKEIND